MDTNDQFKKIIKEEDKILSEVEKEEKSVNNFIKMDTINNKNKSNYVLSISILIAAVLIAGAVIYSKGANVSDNNKNANVAGVGTNSNAFVVQKDDIVLGNSNAPVTIFLYSDPSCPFCAAANGADILAGKDSNGKDIHIISDYLKKSDPTWSAPVPGIIDNYVKTGKVLLVARYYPGHGAGEEAMKILYCANDQGKFWELNDAVFVNQAKVSDANKVKELASSLGIDIAKINSCLDSKKYDSKIVSDTAFGTQAGVNGTPGFFINKTLISGAQPFSQLKKVIDAALQGK
jgi:protein-disulfide isomerase